MIVGIIEGQVLSGESTLRTHESVEIQVCVNANLVLSVEVNRQKDSILLFLQRSLRTSAVYHLRTYVNVQSEGNCFLFVYQSHSADMARKAIPTLNGIESVSVENVDPFPVQVKAVQWVGTETDVFGLGWTIQANDLILWGAATVGILLFCVAGLCVLVFIFNKKERIYAESVLEEDRKLLGKISKGKK